MVSLSLGTPFPFLSLSSIDCWHTVILVLSFSRELNLSSTSIFVVLGVCVFLFDVLESVFLAWVATKGFDSHFTICVLKLAARLQLYLSSRLASVLPALTCNANFDKLSLVFC